jgi:2-polyprenyl-3-methyl-5-hydroxy-6-metoxy-1,4-benzoquinol methylase
MVSDALLGETGYFRNSRPDLEPLLPAQVTRALDVGCGAGEFGKGLQSSRGAEVWGIELRPDVAAVAERSLFRAFAGDATQIMPTLPEGHFDLITFNDVLEHTVEPEKVLRAAAPLLTESGVVLVSLPNLRFWNDFKRLAWNGEFEYVDKGVLDSTHLRFYTKKSIPSFFARAGFRILRMEGLNPTPSRSLKIVNLLTFNRFEDCRYLQFGMIARPLDAA